jgi:hypothetical protein
MQSLRIPRRAHGRAKAACVVPFLVGKALGHVDFSESSSSIKIIHYGADRKKAPLSNRAATVVSRG